MAILLGVPQGSVLGPLFFLLMINDLAYILELMCKLFADDTTLGDVDKDLSTLINRFVNKLKTLLDWCQFNKLDINWSKTFFMFITNKRVKLPTEITVGSKLVNDKSENIKVSVVDSFKLLGVTLDNKLNFVEHCSNLKKIVKNFFREKKFFFEKKNFLVLTMKTISSNLSILLRALLKKLFKILTRPVGLDFQRYLQK